MLSVARNAAPVALTLAILAGGATSAGASEADVIRPFGSPLPLPPAVTQIADDARAELERAAQRDADARAAEIAQAAQRDAAELAARAPAVQEPASAITIDPGKSDDIIARADVLDNGIALPPLESPPAVRAIIEAGNGIARTPYLWGGGHGKWQDKGYDCSGSVSFALASAGLLDRSLTSGQLESWGKPGKGKWVTIWTNAGHVFLEVAGVRFDTSGTRTTGSRWQSAMRPTTGFVARHPPGL